MKNIARIVLLLLLLLMAGCANQPVSIEKSANKQVINAPTKRFNLIAQSNSLLIDENVVHRGFTYNGTSPGPLMLVNEGDNVEITVKNADHVTHGLSMHSANTQTSLKVANLKPGETKKLSFTADVPGVFMYHCAPGGHGIMTHTMGGMFGMFVVEPKKKFALEEDLGRAPDVKVFLVQHETYANGRDFFDGHPLYVSFNGYNFRYVNHPIIARPGDYIRFYYVNVGPNLTATFHAVGGIWNYTYPQGNPANKQIGGQSVLAGPSDSHVIDWQVPAKGPFTLVSHALGTQAAKGAVGIISAVDKAPRPSVVRSEGENLALPMSPKRVVDPFGIGSSDIDKLVHYHEGDPVLIQMVGNSFFPKIVDVPVNTEVGWVNEDVFDVLDGERSGKHSIVTTAGAETFASPELLHADQYHHKFSKPGIYDYICPLHPYMKGKINVY